MIKYECIECDCDFEKANATLLPICPIYGDNVVERKLKETAVEDPDRTPVMNHFNPGFFDDDDWN